MPKPYTLHFDGGSRGNPGPAGIGVVLKQGPAVIWAVGRFIGPATNNVAEYCAVVAGLEEAARRNLTSLEVRGDSELVIRQLLGIYRVKHPDLKPLHARAMELAAQIGDVSFVHNLREHNTLADDLANRAMDARREVLHATGPVSSLSPGSSPVAAPAPTTPGATTPATTTPGLWSCANCGCQIREIAAGSARGDFRCKCGSPMKPA